MARISRIVVPGYPHHLTQRGVRSMAIFSDDGDRQAYISFIAEESRRHGVGILAWCLMTNHVHFIAVPQADNSLARAFGEAHRRYTRMKNFAEGVRGYLFQGRFSSCVLDQNHLLAAVRYVEQNPVRAGIVEQAWDYQWSSAAFHIGKRESDPLVRNRCLLDMEVNWEELLCQQEDEGTELVRRSARTGRPAGDDGFLAMITEVTGRDLHKKQPGRPRKIVPAVYDGGGVEGDCKMV